MPTVLITGGHKGIGREAAAQILSRGGSDVIMAGRNRAEIDTVAREFANRYKAVVETVVLDVSSLASVREAAAAVQAMVGEGTVTPLQVLMLNAGAQFMGPPQYSVVGKASEPDAVRLATDGKHGKPLPWGVRYSTSKLCTVLYAYELDRRLRAKGSSTQSIAFDPGLVVETGLNRSAPAIAQRVMRSRLAGRLFKTLGVTMGSIPFSGDALARLAVDPAFAHASGKYMQSSSGRLVQSRSSDTSYDVGRARKLWADTAKLVGLDV